MPDPEPQEPQENLLHVAVVAVRPPSIIHHGQLQSEQDQAR